MSRPAAAITFGLLLILACETEKLVRGRDANHPPTAHLAVFFRDTSLNVSEGGVISFSASGSTDPDGDELAYSWSFGDGETGTGVAHHRAYADDGRYTASVIVTDRSGAADTASKTLTVTNQPPEIWSLQTPSALPVGAQAILEVTIMDPGSADVITALVDWGDGMTGTITGGLATHSYRATGQYVAKITVSDGDGGSVSGTAKAATTVYGGYELVDLGTLGGNVAVPFAINDSGQVVGYSSTPDGVRHAFLWEKGTIRDLTPGGPPSEAHLIANSGAITGVTKVGSAASHLVIWTKGVMNNLGQVTGPNDVFVDPVTMTGTGDVVARGGGFRTSSVIWQNGVKRQIGAGHAEAWAMNKHRQIVGATAFAEMAGVQHQKAFVWQDGVMKILEPLKSDGSFAVALDINNSGDVVGLSLDSFRKPHAVLWSNGAIRDLGFARAARINEAGEIAGEGNGDVFFWYQGTTTPLGSLGGGESSVADLNNHSTVIGTSLTAEGTPHVFVWKRGQGPLQDLGAGGIASAGAVAVAMNSRGDIVGYSCRPSAGRCDKWEAPLRAILWRVKP